MPKPPSLPPTDTPNSPERGYRLTGPQRRSFDELAYATMLRCDSLAACTEEPGRITRRFLSAPMRTVHDRLRSWMEMLGLETRVDAVGNLFGRRCSKAGKRTLLIGSHLDTVPGGGRYDGVLGVLIGLGVAEALDDADLPFNVEVVGFSEEEGVRFSKPYLGSSAVAGCFESEWLARTDRTGCSVRDAIVEFGGDPARIADAAYASDSIIGYVEAHLEQGPVLERSGSPVGVVSGIVGQSRLRLEFLGEAAHAGTTPMAGRHDAMICAAAFVTEVRSIANQTAGLHATIGKFDVSPNAPNVIADRVELALDIRHPNDPTRESSIETLLTRAEQLADAEGCKFNVIESTGQSAVTVDPGLTDLLAEAITECADEPLRLSSGAGHDAVMMARAFPIAMLFLRHPDGVSHHPDERVDRDDVAVGIEVMTRFVLRLAERFEQPNQENSDL